MSNNFGLFTSEQDQINRCSVLYQMLCYEPDRKCENALIVLKLLNLHHPKSGL